MTTAAPRRAPDARPGPPRRPAAAPAAGPSIDPFRVLRRHMLLLVASVFVGGGLGVAAFFLAARYMPRFDSRVVFKVQPVLSQASEITAPNLRSEDIEIVANSELQLVIDEATLKEALRTADVKGTAWWSRGYGSGEGSIDDAVDELQDELRVGVVPDTDLFMIEWGDRSRDSVPVVLNAIASQYIKRSEKRQSDKFEDTLDRFTKQQTETDTQISVKKLEIQEFIGVNNISTLDDPRYNEVMSALNELTRQVQAIDAGISAAQSRFERISGKIDGTYEPSDEDIRNAELNSSVAAQIQRVNVLEGELGNARARYADESAPQVINALNRLKAAEDVLRDRRDEVIFRNLEADASTIRAEINELERTRETVDEDLLEKGTRQTELSRQFAEFSNLQEEMETLREQKTIDMRNIREVELMKARDDANRTRIYIPSRLPRERAFPQLPIMLPLGVLVVAGLTTGLVFLRELTDRRVRSASDVEIIPGARVLGVIPEAAEDPTRCREPELATWAAPTSVMAESYRQVTNVILKELSLSDLRSVVLTGGMPKAGTTALVSNLGSSAAAAGRDVVVIDANFRRPRLGTVMGGDDEAPGLGDLLVGDVEIEDVVQEHDSGCAWISAGSPEHRIVERLGTAALDRVVALLATRYDLIIFDTAPAIVAGDAMAMAGRVDAAALVVRAGEEERGLVGRLVRQFAGVTSLVGVVLNRPRGTAGGYFRKNFAVMASYAVDRD